MAVRQSPKLYSQIATHQHSMPTAVELRINHSPIQAEPTRGMKKFIDELPSELKNIFDGGIGDIGVPSNPMRGYTEWR